jgi:hypothetical protein
MRPRLLCSAALLLACSCVVHFGTRAEDMPIANSPAGSEVSLDLRSGGKVIGELLATRDSGLVVLSAGRLSLVPFESLERVVLPGNRFSLAGGQRPTPDSFESLQLASRYPQDIDAALMSRLLAQLGQPALQVVRP